MRTIMLLAATGLYAAALCAGSGHALAAATKDCAAITDPAARLACYDEKNRSMPVPAEPAPPPAQAPAPPAPPAEGAAAKAADGSDEFGKKKKTPAEELSSIRARIVGKLTHWEKGTEFTLDNGQVWKAIEQDSGHYPSIPENPEVRISRGVFGGFWLEIVAVNARIKVKRVS